MSCHTLLAVIMAMAMLLRPSAFSAASAEEEEYPQSAITLITSAMAYSEADLFIRSFNEKLSNILGQPITIENMPGAAGNIAAAHVSRSEPDGSLILLGSINITIATWLSREPPFNPATDFAHVGHFATAPNALVVSPALGISTISELIELARSRPGELTYSTSGNGSIQHIVTNTLLKANDIKMVHVPYKAGKASLNAVLSGDVDLLMTGLLQAIQQIRDGNLLTLAVTSAERFSLLPNVPTLSETALPGHTSETWFGLFMAKNTPGLIVNTINKAMNQVLQDETVQENLAKVGATPQIGSPEEFSIFVKKESRYWRNFMKNLGIYNAL